MTVLRMKLPCKSSTRSILRPCCAAAVKAIAYSLSHLTFCNKHRFITSSKRSSASCRKSNASCADLPCSADEKPIFVNVFSVFFFTLLVSLFRFSLCFLAFNCYPLIIIILLLLYLARFCKSRYQRKPKHLCFGWKLNKMNTPLTVKYFFIRANSSDIRTIHVSKIEMYGMQRLDYILYSNFFFWIGPHEKGRSHWCLHLTWIVLRLQHLLVYVVIYCSVFLFPSFDSMHFACDCVSFPRLPSIIFF